MLSAASFSDGFHVSPLTLILLPSCTASQVGVCAEKRDPLVSSIKLPTSACSNLFCLLPHTNSCPDPPAICCILGLYMYREGDPLLPPIKWDQCCQHIFPQPNFSSPRSPEPQNVPFHISGLCVSDRVTQFISIKCGC